MTDNKAAISFTGDGTITNFSSSYPDMGAHVEVIGVGAYKITVGPKHKVYQMTEWLKKQHPEEEKKKPNNILRNLFWIGVVCAILAAIVM